MTGEPTTEALVNDSHNSNGPKVAKFLFEIGFGLFLRTLGGRRRSPPFGGPELSMRFHS
ncbi:hypothetical protein Gogos_015355 [Gossypium gossypioides]|uniref:Uncharacterized protein n=1 Tax=Gossypium gossypioides TaxID=34282 RepID=A0A7J9C1I2_GOSGO|nr:hypothetical protein [Gossypium gossypioides]